MGLAMAGACAKHRPCYWSQTLEREKIGPRVHGSLTEHTQDKIVSAHLYIATKGLFTYSDCESDVAKNGFIAFLYYYLHLAMVNIKGKVTPQSPSQSLYVNEP